MLRSLTYGLYGAVLAGLIAATLAWINVDKSVDLVVDGHGHTVSTTANDVDEVLHAHGYHVDKHDLLAPSGSSGLHDGMRVVLRHGRLLHLVVDGRHKSVWTTAMTVSDALRQLGYSTSDYVSVSRSKRLPLRPTDIAIRTPREVTVIHDGRTDQVSSTDATVGALLADLDVTVGPHDRLSHPQSSPLVSGETIRLQRVGEKTVVKTEMVAFTVKHVQNGSMPDGKTKIKTKGHKGKRRVVYSIVSVDGKVRHRTEVTSKMMDKPVTEIVEVGTKAPKGGDAQQTTVSVGNPPPGSARALAKQLLAERGWSDQFSCLDQMWDRESGWRTNAANPSGAYGIPQALPGSKMASAGPDWQTSAETQIKWGLKYIKERYSTPCGAWGFWQAHGYY